MSVFLCLLFFQSSPANEKTNKETQFHVLYSNVSMQFIFSFQVDQLAAGLLSLGLRKGDRVGMWGPNMRAWVLTQYATAKAGLILVRQELAI